MNAKEKARPGAGTPERAAEMTACRASIPMSDCNTAAASRQRRISDLLDRGQENAVPLRHLTKVMDTDERTVRLMIERERRSGTPICADNLTGYYIAANEAEKAACVRSMRHRAAEILAAARSIDTGGDADWTMH